jgi:hypothetical protein
MRPDPHRAEDHARGAQAPRGHSHLCLTLMSTHHSRTSHQLTIRSAQHTLGYVTSAKPRYCCGQRSAQGASCRSSGRCAAQSIELST